MEHSRDYASTLALDCGCPRAVQLDEDDTVAVRGPARWGEQIADAVLYPIGLQLLINLSSRRVMEIVFSLTLIPHLP